MELIDTRSVQKVGGAFMISLPKPFIDAMNIKKGDIINVYRDGSSLILTKGIEKIIINEKEQGELDAKE